LDAYAFTGKYFDEDTGLQNNLNRWYDPEIGRWLSEDPIGFEGDSSNLYRYVGNAPSVYVDPMGLEQCGPRVWLYTGSWCVPDNVYDAAIQAAGGVVTCWWVCEKKVHLSGAAVIADAAGAGGALGFTHLPIPKPPSLVIPGHNVNTTIQSLSSYGAKVCNVPGYGDLLELSSIVVDEGFCQAAASWDLTPSVN
jgi:RHS repeat-associated protein